MTCYSPLQGYRTRDGDVVWSARKGTDSHITVSCGRCVGCRVSRSRSWALRITHEAKLWPSSWFVTLTYSDPPPGGSLRYRDVQLFLKRLRKAVPTRIRFFCVGEYGSLLSRPHYHLCLFNAELADRKPLSLNSRSFTSRTLESAWGLGYVQVDQLNYSTAAYAARYIFKKISGDQADEHYQVVDADGVVHRVEPEFFRGDSVISAGREFPLPRYYDRLQKRRDPSILEAAREGRESRAMQRDRHWRRLEAASEIALSRLSQSSRSFEL